MNGRDQEKTTDRDQIVKDALREYEQRDRPTLATIRGHINWRLREEGEDDLEPGELSKRGSW